LKLGGQIQDREGIEIHVEPDGQGFIRQGSTND